MFPDAYFDAYANAYAELERRRSLANSDEAVISRIEDSPYGGFKVWSMPAEVYADLLSEILSTGPIGPRRFPKIPA